MRRLPLSRVLREPGITSSRFRPLPACQLARVHKIAMPPDLRVNKAISPAYRIYIYIFVHTIYAIYPHIRTRGNTPLTRAVQPVVVSFEVPGRQASTRDDRCSMTRAINYYRYDNWTTIQPTRSIRSSLIRNLIRGNYIWTRQDLKSSSPKRALLISAYIFPIKLIKSFR